MIPASLSDIARSTGFSVSTVSRALRNSAEISHSTQKKVKDVARRLGYRPNPILASLARSRFSTRSADGIPLAYLHLPVDVVYLPLVQKIIRANQEHAQKLGYRVEPYLISEFKDGAQATRILFSRGFQGIILPEGFQFDMLPGMDWNRFSIAGWGQITEDPTNPFESLVNHAAVDYFRCVLRAWQETNRRGYRRIGFALFAFSTLTDQLISGAVQVCLQDRAARRRIPPFLLDPTSNPLDTPGFARWVHLHRLDAVIGFNGIFRWMLNHEGFRTPEDIGFATLQKDMISEQLGTWDYPESGMRHMRLETMFAAIELLDQQIRHREFGLVPSSRIQLIQSRWVDGETLPTAKSRS